MIEDAITSVDQLIFIEEMAVEIPSAYCTCNYLLSFRIDV